MSDKATVRDLNGEPVIFQEFRGNIVAVSIGGHDRELPLGEWQLLPPYDPATRHDGPGTV